MLMSSARLVQEQRLELEYLRDLIGWRLKLADQEPSEWNRDDPFYWRTLRNRGSVPVDGLERLSGLFDKGEYEKAEALAKLLTDCWDNYAEGYNYLGLIALERGELDIALTWFEKAMAVGRTLFPKHIAKDSYWSDHSTRPYIRSLVSLAQTHNRIGDFAAALHYCEKLDKECHQDDTAANVRTPIYINSGAFHQAVDSAKSVHRIYPQENLPLAFAYHEIGEKQEARVHFLAGGSPSECSRAVPADRRPVQDTRKGHRPAGQRRRIARQRRHRENAGAVGFERSAAISRCRGIGESSYEAPRIISFYTIGGPVSAARRDHSRGCG